jgi:hypothetical protein
VWDFAQGYASLRTGQADFAKAYLVRAQKTVDESTSWSTTSLSRCRFPLGIGSARRSWKRSGLQTPSVSIARI